MQKEKLAPSHARSWLLLGAAVAGALLALVLSRVIVLTGEPDLYPVAGAFVFGSGIIAAAFILAWASEVAQLDISQALALAFVALIAVLPEYAVDIYLAWQAGADPASEFSSYAAANMTGANRLLVGLGWPMVVLVFWFQRRESVAIGRGISLELAFLVIGSVYSLTIFLKGSIALWDTAMLFPMFGIYMWLSGRAEKHEPELIGPSLAIASLGKKGRRWVMVALFFFAAAAIILSAELFVENLIETGELAGIDEFILIQWLAPLASEAPEMLIAGYFVVRGNPAAALTMLISATVNQWTLLVGSLPVAYSLSFGAPASLPLDGRQRVEFFLTMAQALFAIVLVARSKISWKGATVLLALFLGQLVSAQTGIRLSFALLFLGLTAALFIADRERRQGMFHLPGYVVRAVRD